MLYNTKWEVQAKLDMLSLEGLIAWLETMPADLSYDYKKLHRSMFVRPVYGVSRH